MIKYGFAHRTRRNIKPHCKTDTLECVSVLTVVWSTSGCPRMACDRRLRFGGKYLHESWAGCAGGRARFLVVRAKKDPLGFDQLLRRRPQLGTNLFHRM